MVDKQTARIERIHNLLASEYGLPPLKGDRDPLSELMATILSQNTSDLNSHRAFKNLKRRYPTWQDVHLASRGEIAEAIKVGGLFKQKAKRIKSILQEIYQQEGRLDLSFLRGMDANAAKSYLLRFRGVGPKTAACVLLFSLRKPSMPVDTHILRVSKRIGLVPRRANVGHAQSILGGITPPQLIYSLHLNLIKHGRRFCKARAPLCGGCILRPECDYPQKRT